MRVQPQLIPPVTPELLARHDRPGPRYTSYPTALEFSEEYGPDDHAARLRGAAASPGPLSLYVHLPFCQARCSFCACHVVITRNQRLQERYLDTVTREAETVAGLLGDRIKVVQYHWGGGTPTFHSPSMLRRLHQRLCQHFTIVPGAEMAVEVDPRVTSREHLETLAALGFNRLSVGVQDLDPRVQELIGRGQTQEQSERLVEEARKAGFASINLDLVYGLPGQTPGSLEQTLEAVVRLRPERLAVYSFAYVPWMRSHQRRIDPQLLPAREEKFELLSRLVARLTAAGYQPVGMDHFALADDELAVAAREGTLTRNFMGYTTRRGTDVVALGSSGISDLDGAYAQNHRSLSAYLEAAGSGSLPVERGFLPSQDDRIRRHVITELMCRGWVDLGEVGEHFGIEPFTYFAHELARLHSPAGLISEGMASLEGTKLQASALGRLFIRRLAMVFDAYLPDGEPGQPRFSRTI